MGHDHNSNRAAPPLTSDGLLDAFFKPIDFSTAQPLTDTVRIIGSGEIVVRLNFNADNVRASELRRFICDATVLLGTRHGHDYAEQAIKQAMAALAVRATEERDE
ncbi:MAG: hypothetical protein KGL26_01070 [Pseudomonadota bacterium]|nr:hypothetical protein [Pseudomonadota bacterium]